MSNKVKNVLYGIHRPPKKNLRGASAVRKEIAGKVREQRNKYGSVKSIYRQHKARDGGINAAVHW